MRVTERSLHERTARYLETSYASFAEAQLRLANGKRLNNFSDDPSDAVRAAGLRHAERLWGARQAAAQEGLAALAVQDNALQQASSLLVRARELVISASNDIQTGPTRQSIATELEEIRDQLVTLANSRHDGRAVFGGYSPHAVELTDGLAAFVGDRERVSVRVAPEVLIGVSTDGFTTFGFDSDVNVFSLLGRAAAHIRAGEVDVVRTDDLEALQRRTDAVTSALGAVGARANQLEHSRDMASETSIEVSRERSELEDADLAKAATDVKSAEAGYTATLAAVAKLDLPSLIDFLQ